uniref:Uncharacterized protein n=1 Tax=Oryza punctata TaxID=4537 RepID=A0A0E0K5L1_ORYPU
MLSEKNGWLTFFTAREGDVRAGSPPTRSNTARWGAIRPAKRGSGQVSQRRRESTGGLDEARYLGTCRGIYPRSAGRRLRYQPQWRWPPGRKRWRRKKEVAVRGRRRGCDQGRGLLPDLASLGPIRGHEWNSGRGGSPCPGDPWRLGLELRGGATSVGSV